MAAKQGIRIRKKATNKNAKYKVVNKKYSYTRFSNNSKRVKKYSYKKKIISNKNGKKKYSYKY